MPILNRASDMQAEIAAWRRSIHETPELNYDVVQTAAFVAAKLRDFGVDEVVEGLGRTGVVGLIKGSKGEGPVIGLRADMDALPMTELTGKPWASKTPGKMHACGHDGHTAMLLGAARYLAETRNFCGSVAVIFQPAEEGGGGGDAMVRDGMMERFGIAEVYGMHNLPGLGAGKFATRKGPIMASTDEFLITVRGKGAHAAMPHRGVDPIVIAAQIVSALQTIVSRVTDPFESTVVTVTKFNAGTAMNVIPDEAHLGGTIRTLNAEQRNQAQTRLKEIVTGVATALGAEADVRVHTGYPVTVNHGAQTEAAVRIAVEIAGAPNVDGEGSAMMGGEDFSYMLNARPGNFIFIGNGDSAGLHNPRYDFNDEIIPYGVSYWVKLAETRLAELG
ncbi:amidohydrolase [Rhizobium sp. SG_E_25_P2]|uniref:M20 aminoacylase family protein n=1 Tax=Rhizobium sp. SG_E_25_P2 TaxID=2879942 RepID=UPI00247568E5|nr:M20 aminoacylase family protein [Rhizobium sp. SG_E_25_P2]MDH6269440.1 amidohydrolase [Rhizobium sp. SG_E_25_P2]